MGRRVFKKNYKGHMDKTKVLEAREVIWDGWGGRWGMVGLNVDNCI